ncbi:hypothetical protein GCM10007301_02950 [Azorhizobium oxalatiphilum]|uniref:Uncharacterized protein n=1 Tax=Azorhizobium oxalatiphilum TaxID=980631 RepID=A0A917BKQ5_9HYPH|nr:hypothetical protein GCM10007301_02950 [Azorhizobium oxalatiphilum]
MSAFSASVFTAGAGRGRGAGGVGAGACARKGTAAAAAQIARVQRNQPVRARMDHIYPHEVEEM